MSSRSLEWVPLMLATEGISVEPAVATVVLTGPGGGRHEVQLGGQPAATDATPAFVMTLDVVDYCRAVGRRLPEAGLAYEATGDTELARTVIGALGALAQV